MLLKRITKLYWRRIIEDLLKFSLIGFTLNLGLKIVSTSVEVANFKIFKDLENKLLLISKIRLETLLNKSDIFLILIILFLLILYLLNKDLQYKGLESARVYFRFAKFCFHFSMIFSVVTSNLTSYFWSVFLIFFICLLEQEIKNSDLDYSLYNSRKLKSKILIELLKEKSKRMIVIDGEWGIGKTYFVNSVLDSKELSDNHIIKIDALTSPNKEVIINQTLFEIKSILLKEGVKSSLILQYRDAINFVSKRFFSNFNILIREEGLQKIEKNLRNHMHNLKNQIIIVVENLERIMDKEKTIEVLGFLHKFNEIVDYQMKIIVVANLQSGDFDEKFLNYASKFFTEKIILKDIDYKEILEKQKNKDTWGNTYKYLLDNISKVYEKFIKVNKSDERDFIMFLENILKKVKNPRNIEKIMANSLINYKIHMEAFEAEKGLAMISTLFIDTINETYRYFERDLRKIDDKRNELKKPLITKLICELNMNQTKQLDVEVCLELLENKN